jgi:hypothetical protein
MLLTTNLTGLNIWRIYGKLLTGKMSKKDTSMHLKKNKRTKNDLLTIPYV